MLKNLINNEKSDKDTIHSYIDVYENLLCSKKESATHILELGVLDGGSIKLWKDYFKNAIVYGLDIKDSTKGWDGVIDDRIKLIFNENAYSRTYVRKHFQNMKFDMLLDDGPHSLESMKQFITLYLPLLKDDGILIIEDVQSIEWIDHLTLITPDKYKDNIWTFDRRFLKDRYDDIIFCIDLSKKN